MNCPFRPGDGGRQNGCILVDNRPRMADIQNARFAASGEILSARIPVVDQPAGWVENILYIWKGGNCQCGPILTTATELPRLQMLDCNAMILSNS